jgi:glycosyltransferase involved in cell wall biosynthesis
MNLMPSLSIVIPSYNQGRYIERTILSILKQDYSGEVEIIVSDGGSQDETTEILKKYSQIKWWSEPDKGFVDAVNKGFKIASGEILAIQSSDDFYLRDAFKNCVGRLINSNIDIVSGCDVHLRSDQKNFSLPELKFGAITPRSLLLERAISQHCCFFRREVLDKIGGLRKEVDTCADIDFWYRALHFFQAEFIPCYVAVYQEHENQRTKTLTDWHASLLRMVGLWASDEIYGQKIMLDQESKKTLFSTWEIQFEILHGKHKVEKNQIAKDLNGLLNSAEYSLETKNMLQNLGIQHGFIKKMSFAEKIGRSMLNKSFVNKVNKRLSKLLHVKELFYETFLQKGLIDIDWWK